MQLQPFLKRNFSRYLVLTLFIFLAFPTFARGLRPQVSCEGFISKVGYWFSTRYSDRGKKYVAALDRLERSRSEREERHWAERRQEIEPLLRAQIPRLGDRLREAVYDWATKNRAQALKSKDVSLLVAANSLAAESSNPNARNYDWIFEAQLEEALDRVRQNPDLSLADAFPTYMVKDYLNSDAVTPEFKLNSKAARSALIEFQNRLTRHKALSEGEVKLLVSRESPGFAYLKFGPLNEAQAQWVEHVWGSRELDGILFETESRCSEMACYALIEADRLTESTTIEKLKRDQERHLTKPQISERTGEVEFLDNVAGRFAYLTLGMMGYFKNERKRVAIPKALMSENRVATASTAPPTEMNDDILVIGDEKDEIQFLD